MDLSKLSVLYVTVDFMKMTELQRVLSIVDEHPGLDVESIAQKSGMGGLVVELILQELEYQSVVIEEDTRYAISRFGDEVMAARSSVQD